MSEATLFDRIEEGERRKAEAFARLTDGEARTEYTRRCQLAFVELLGVRPEATIEDVREQCPVPERFGPRILGPVTSNLAKAGVILFVRYERATRAEAHRRPVAVWRLAAPAVVAAWRERIAA